MSNFHEIPQQLGCHSHLSKLNDDISIYNHLTNQPINQSTNQRYLHLAIIEALSSANKQMVFR